MSDQPAIKQSAFCPVEVVQRQLDAYNARDVDAFVATYSPTVTIIRRPNGQVILDGVANLLKSYGDFFSNNPELHCEILNRIVLGNFVIDQEYVTGRVAAPPVNAVVIYEVQDGLIQRVWMLPNNSSSQGS